MSSDDSNRNLADSDARTEQVQTRTEQAKTRSEHAESISVLLATIVDSSEDAIISKDLNGVISSWNKGAEKVFGYTSSEIVGTSILRLIPADRQDEENYILDKIRRGEKVERFETQRKKKDGRLIDVSVTASPIRDVAGKVIGVSKVAHDITERKRTEEALIASELSYRRLFETAQDGILILDVATGRINDVNSFLFNLLGFSRAEMIGKTIGALSPFKDIEENRVMLSRLQKDGYVRYEDLPLETRDGRHIAVEFVSNVYQAGDKNVIQCNIRDNTERKHAQDEIRRLNLELERRVAERTAQLKSANEELEAFSYSVSHDLRAPLRHVMGFVNLLQKDAGPSLSEKNLQYLTTISEAAKRMGTLIDDLLSFSRVGRDALQKTDINLDELLLAILGEFQIETRERNIVWEIQPLPPVRADRNLLRLVLINLISNAVKFTSHRTEARIEIGCVPNDKGETVIFVRDNGAGFDPKYAHKLFGVFQRLHSNAEFEGTGIGLANVQRIIHRHGGRVWAEGAVDAGATFYLSIPKPNGAGPGR
jgi:PAS domain S-box-containing protein